MASEDIGRTNLAFVGDAQKVQPNGSVSAVPVQATSFAENLFEKEEYYSDQVYDICTGRLADLSFCDHSLYGVCMHFLFTVFNTVGS